VAEYFNVHVAKWLMLGKVC